MEIFQLLSVLLGYSTLNHRLVSFVDVRVECLKICLLNTMANARRILLQA